MVQSREVPGGDPVLSLGDFFFSNVGMETQCMDLAPLSSPSGTIPLLQDPSLIQGVLFVKDTGTLLLWVPLYVDFTY